MGIFICKESECIKCGRNNCISSIPLLSNLSDEEAQKISKGVSTVTFKKGDQVFKKGDKANKLFILCNGKIKLFKNTKEGKEQIIYIMSNGDFFGAFNLLKEDEMDLDAVAIEDSQVSLLEKREFDRIILSNPEITLKVFEKAYERIIKAEALVDRLSTNSPDSRVAGLLLNLIEDFGVRTEDGMLLKLSINREEMGSYAGIARETMSRKLNLFQEMGIIRLVGSKQILLEDVDGLEDMK
jgi:CRP/FNR family transcriptional regulator, anaerobic regulatory protein